MAKKTANSRATRSRSGNAKLAQQRTDFELNTIAAGQSMCDQLQRSIDELRTKNGLDPLDCSSKTYGRLLNMCISVARDAISHNEIDAAARDIYGTIFERISICEAHRKALDLACQRKATELARLYPDGR